MYSKTEVEKEGTASVVNFTYDQNKGIQFEYIEHSFFILDDFNPKTPARALFIQKKGKLERISGLFPNERGNILKGDVKKKDERKFFSLEYLSKSQFSIEGLFDALVYKGVVPSKDKNKPNLECYRPSQGDREGGSLCIS